MTKAEEIEDFIEEMESHLVASLREANEKTRQQIAELDKSGKWSTRLVAIKSFNRALLSMTEEAINSGDVVLMMKASAANGLENQD